MVLFVPLNKRFRDKYFDPNDSEAQQLIDQCVSYIYDIGEMPEYRGFWSQETGEQVCNAFNSEIPQRWNVSQIDEYSNIYERTIKRLVFSSI
jgi:hypothetical protein